MSDRAPSDISRGSSTPPAATPPSDSLWVRWTRIAPGMQPIITVVAALATLMVAFSAYYSGVIKAQERIERDRLCNLVGYRNSAYFVGRYVVDTLTNKHHGNPEALTNAVLKADDSALYSIPLKDLPGDLVGYFTELIFDNELTKSFALKINKEDPNDPATMLSSTDQQMLKEADERLERAMNAIDEDLARYGVTFTTGSGGINLASAARCQPGHTFSGQ